jgi:chemotaxis methyl-accepting protein methylase
VPHDIPHGAPPGAAPTGLTVGPPPAAGGVAPGAAELDEHDPEGLAALLAQVEREHGFRATSYKERCLRRRVAVRMRATGTHRFADYAARLQADPREYARLVDALTINVTKLFRNWDAWAALDALVLTPFAESARRGAEGGGVRAWSAGCSTGEEAYSLAALLHARLGAAAGAAVPRVLGTDVDAPSLAAAAAGVYAEPAFADAPGDLRARYFAEPATIASAAGSAGAWRVAPELRALTRFAAHDLLRDPAPAGPWDLIACRNVVIYFDRASQEALFERFHAALAPGGVLFLGRVETLLGHMRLLFTPLDARQRLFRRVG